MRKHDPRKWLHAVLDLLPVIFIPVFMVYSHRHTIDNLQVQYAQNEVVDFNQLISNDDLNSTFTSHGVTFTKIDGGFHVTGTHVEGNLDYNFFSSTIQLDSEHVYYIKCVEDCNLSVTSTTSVYTSTPYRTNGAIAFRYYYQILSNDTSTFDVYLYPQLFDLTQMFGVGNEPTLEQFDLWYPNDYYSYTTSRKELLKDVSTVTYNNTDIGSQLLYSIYNPVHDYMNFNNVFNFGQIYDWLQLNIFGGTAPISVFIVWNIVLYEFLMDLIFLLYALFMFFIDFCTNLIDRFHTKCSGGK